MTIIDRFETFFTKVKGCWEVTSSVNSTGRGLFWMNGKNVKSHRASWIIYRGEIPIGMNVLHKCDNGKCVNPEHLFLGTLRDNTQDMITKGRHVGNTKIDLKTAIEIRKEYKRGNRTYKQLADKYRIKSSSQIGRIINFKRKIHG